MPLFLILAIVIVFLFSPFIIRYIKTNIHNPVFRILGYLALYMICPPIALKFIFTDGVGRHRKKSHNKTNYQNNNYGNMTESEAYQILDIPINASNDVINASFKKLMLKNHPDKGGSKYIAQKIIAARETLININKRRKI